MQDSKKRKIIDSLSNAGDAVSGEELAKTLGVSRTAVWKNISALKNLGYSIESNRKGYRLISATDKPVPLEMNSALIKYHNELDSTMHQASRLIEAGCSDGTVVIAGSQTAGKDREGGHWKSPDGGLYLTRVRMQPFPALYAGLYIVSMAAAVIDMLKKKHSFQAGLNWPGAIEYEDRKLGGLLVDFRGENDIIYSAASGLGLNLNNTDGIPTGAACLSDITGKSVSIKKITASLLVSLEQHESEFPRADTDRLYKNYIKQAEMRCRVIKSCGRTFSGRIINLHESGALIITTDDNRKEYIFSGDKIKYE